MKVIIAGSRSFDGRDIDLIEEAVSASGFEVTEVVSGTARGIDSLGEDWADEKGIPISRFRPEWRKNGVYNRGAGFARNIDMAKHADALIAVYDGKSKGTKHMIGQMKKRNKLVYVHQEDID